MKNPRHENEPGKSAKGITDYVVGVVQSGMITSRNAVIKKSKVSGLGRCSRSPKHVIPRMCYGAGTDVKV